MVLKVYNTLTREMEEFEPIDGKKVHIYVCGPTVYDHCHLGHARSYVSFDVIRRYLVHKGYDVTYISNITDVDDKVIKRAKWKGKDPIELSREFAESYFEDMERLGVLLPDFNPRVTDHIPEIIEVVEGLVEKGMAYVSTRGNVYFDLMKSKDKIGVLSHQTVEALLEGSGSRVETEDDKRFPLDFALWKASEPDEPGWESPWGRGRPGWHIECSVMSMKYGGGQLDIHGGGMDLVFPHHEAEIHQSECYMGKGPFAKYWLHNGFLTIDKRKMSKSLGNFFTIKEVLERFSPKTIRFFILNTQYRRPIDFSDQHLEEAGKAHDRIANSIVNAREAIKKASDDGDDLGLGEAVKEAKRIFEESMDDDFNTREALAGVFVLARKMNEALSKGTPNKGALKDFLEFFADIGDVFGMFKEEALGDQAEGKGPSDDEVVAMLKEREKARKAKDWAKADEIRDRLKELGIIIEDHKDGVKWRRT
jgi:cysteinyl-tRNA synthetase